MFMTRSISVVHLCDLFWPEAEEKKARQNLNDAFYNLRKNLKKAGGTEAHQNSLSRLRNQVQFDRDCEYTCDVESFEHIVNVATHQTDLRLLEAARSLYRGPFLDGFYVQDAPLFDAWVQTKRRELTSAYHKLLHLLLPHYLSAANWPSAIECLEFLRRGLMEALEQGEEWTQVGREAEVVHGLLMICYALTSQLERAQTAYQQYMKVFAGHVAPALDELHKIIHSYQLSNMHTRSLISDALDHLNRREMEPRLEDALVSIYTATGALQEPLAGATYHQVLKDAQEAALRHGARLIGTPHLALALCNISNSNDEPDIDVSYSLGVSLDTIIRALRGVLGEDASGNQNLSEQTLPLQRVMRIASELAAASRSEAIDCVHLWRALLREETGLFSQVLSQCGVHRLQALQHFEDEVL